MKGPPVDLDSVAHDLNAVARDFDSFPLRAKHASILFVKWMPVRRQRALDIGCGTGRTAGKLAKHFREVVGIDVSVGMLAVARERCEAAGAVNVTFIEMDALVLQFPEESFDYVVSHTTLHHVPDLDTALREIRRVLRPGGRAVLVDVLREGVTGWCPAAAMWLLAVYEFLRCVPRTGLATAGRNLARWTSGPWMRHQRSERFIDREVLEQSLWRAMSGARVSVEAAELGMTRYATVVWDRPQEPS